MVDIYKSFSVFLVLFGLNCSVNLSDVFGQRQMEDLNRGLVAVRTSENSSFISWRLLEKDDYDTPFYLYRQYGNGRAELITDEPLTEGTCYEDENVDFSKQVTYYLKSELNGREVEEDSIRLASDIGIQQYLEIPLKTPEGYSPGDVSVGDLDGDGSYELIVHQVGKGHDNSHKGITSEPIFQAYKLDGTFLWEINLGKNIREGAHYTQFMVYDLDGDGYAEFVCKTADGTRDGLGNYIGDPNADWRDKDESAKTYGHIVDGPEYLTVFDGRTGKEISTVDYLPERGDMQSWGDTKANRSERYLAAVAYLDGEHPSLIMTRGYYARTALVAWDFDGEKLIKRWVFDTKTGDHPYAGQGFHSLAVADVDFDGKDEIIFGAMCIDDDGTGLYTTGLGHGDAMHVTDLDPDRPGLEVFSIHERQQYGATLRDAGTGEILFKGAFDQDVPRGVAANIDPNHKGAYMWWLGSDVMYDMKGQEVGPRPRPTNFLIWWDDDLSRELLDRNYIEKYGEGIIFKAEGASSINGTKSTPNLSADILGDWREELILRSDDNQSLRIYTTVIPTEHRLYTLMHDPTYRLSIAWQNVAYNQPPHTGYYLGTGMKLPQSRPNVKIVKPKSMKK